VSPRDAAGPLAKAVTREAIRLATAPQLDPVVSGAETDHAVPVQETGKQVVQSTGGKIVHSTGEKIVIGALIVGGVILLAYAISSSVHFGG
jgi:hypothetical protein